MLSDEPSGYVLTAQLKRKIHERYPKPYPFDTYCFGDAIQTAGGEEDVAVTRLQLDSAYYAFANGVTLQVAVKTGTAQVVSDIPHTSAAYKQPTSVFLSFVPTDNPQYVVDGFLPEGGCGAAALPAVRQMYDIVLRKPVQVAPING